MWRLNQISISLRTEEAVRPVVTPYYPASELPDFHSKCLEAIRRPWNKAGGILPPAPPPPPPPLASTTEDQLTVKVPPSPGKEARNHGRTRNVSQSVLYNSLVKGHKSPSRQSKVHVKPNKAFVKPHKSPGKEILKRLKAPPTNHTHFLTTLPATFSYNSLLLSLRQDSKTSPSSSPPSSQQYPPAPPHKHAVYHDHFALLSARHVPDEFSEPVTSLLLSIPREHHTTCIQCRTTRLDHSYAGLTPPSLSVSLPRSLLATECVCNGEPLTYCSLCQSLYHGACTRQCPGCSA